MKEVYGTHTQDSPSSVTKALRRAQSGARTRPPRSYLLTCSLLPGPLPGNIPQRAPSHMSACFLWSLISSQRLPSPLPAHKLAEDAQLFTPKGLCDPCTPIAGKSVVMGKQKSQAVSFSRSLFLKITSVFTPLMSLSTLSSSNVTSFFFSSFSPFKAQTPPTDPRAGPPETLRWIKHPCPSFQENLGGSPSPLPSAPSYFISPKPNKSNFISKPHARLSWKQPAAAGAGAA